MASSPNKWKGPQPAPAHMGRVLRANFPQITQTGVYNNRNVAGTNKPSAHAEGRAIDIHLDATNPSQRVLGDQLFHAIIRTARNSGVDNAIWNRQIWSVSRGGPRAFSGSNPHTDHIHVEFTHAGSQRTTLNDLLIHVGIIRTGMEDLSKAHRDIG